jgi:hypothetical protein
MKYLSRYNEGLRAGRPGLDSWQGKFFFSSPQRPDLLLRSTQRPIQ